MLTRFMVFCLVPGCSESRGQREAPTGQAGSQGLPGLHAGGVGAGIAGPWNCHGAQGPLRFLPEAHCWKGGRDHDVGPTAMYVCRLSLSTDCAFS